ncbi:DUF3800 domain-containing protein [Clostridium botulinum]|uniref:DUF3800 domain-containing protein n=1 Tax=Clostridium botulinum TaxID=1491 RepID=UPI0013C9EFA5|nr:DUF3800 domain-containing protein [Clostridium botulinum]MBY6915637.1 DUF3800 domain-containing protein [Clostridium botulinum]NFG42072.1 DUF3800 domain-containing protein [Clostridium botulinum]NFN18601.1 DUF3800 domain-containing protein [Clostridium botulinum]NFN48385.1 DUF3800 domain-containing protein [Clostridium botulinum]NFO41542.1 DUF3800 domain-containing protein [Clostridium botulinum]
MSCTLFIDESGSISPNNGERYFIIAGYLIEKGNLNHKYKMIKILKNVRKERDKYFNSKAKKDKKDEVKFSNLNVDGKNYVYDKFENLDGTFVSIVVDKYNCTSLTSHKYNDYYNYLVYELIRYIFETRHFKDPTKLKELKIIFDNRSMKIAANNDLQTYLIKKFKICKKYNKFSCNFNIKEADSKVNYGVMISDFIAGLCWARYNFGLQKYGNNVNIEYLSKFPYRHFGENKEIIEEKVLTNL